MTPPPEPGPITTVLVDGLTLRIRPVHADDATALRAMHRGLSTQTVYQRFFGYQPELSPSQADHFTHVDGTTRVAFVAQAPDGALVAVGRYDRLPPALRRAEAAVVVADRFQHHGLGTMLVTLLRSHAAEAGVAEFVADVLTTNSAMQHAFADAGLVAHPAYDSGVSHLVMPLS